MKSIRYYMVSFLLVAVFVTGMLLNTHAEGEDSTDDTSAVISINEPSQDSAESSIEEGSFEESSFDEPSVESSLDSEVESFPESSLDSEVESFPESSLDSQVESSMESSLDSEVESTPESSLDSQVQSDPESSLDSDTESSDETPPESSAESSIPPQDSSYPEESSREETSVPEENSRQQEGSHTSTDTEEPSEVSLTPGSFIQPKRDPLHFLEGLSTVIPAQREPSEEPEYSSVASWSETSEEEVSYRPIGDVPLVPINETAPDAAAVQPTHSNSARPFLIGIIIFSLFGMGLTAAVILLLRARGDFAPSFLKPHSQKTQHKKGKYHAR